MARKKKSEPRQYSVPMRWELRGYGLVTATSPEEAKELAEDGKAELQEDATAELVNWEVTGTPEVND